MRGRDLARSGSETSLRVVPGSLRLRDLRLLRSRSRPRMARALLQSIEVCQSQGFSARCFC